MSISIAPAFFNVDPCVWEAIESRKSPDDAALQPPKPRKGGRINAGMDIRKILAALSRIGWGPMRGTEFGASRQILTALVHVMEDQKSTLTASCTTTSRQLAKRASVSLRHAGRCLHWMEDAGVIEWYRGGIRSGSPTPGMMRIVKKKLVEWILAFRRRSDAEDRKRNAQTRLRLQQYRIHRNNQTPKPAHNAHVDMMSPHPSLRDEGASTPAPESSKKNIPSQEENMSALPDSIYMPLVCTHGAATPKWCNACRSQAWQAQHEDEAKKADEAARLRAEAMTAQERENETKGKAFTDYMNTHYPNARKAEWPDIINNDPQAWMLANA